MLKNEHVYSVLVYADKRREFTWERRIKIAHGAAKGLEYLHGKQSYGSVRPSNILITHDYHPLVNLIC